MRKTVATKKAPAAIGPYAQANIVDNFVFTSGQIPLDPDSGAIVDGGIEVQTRQVFANLSAVLEEAGSSLEDMVKTTCFLADMEKTTESRVVPSQILYALRIVPSYVNPHFSITLFDLWFTRLVHIPT